MKPGFRFAIDRGGGILARSKRFFSFETFVLAIILGTVDAILVTPVLPFIMKEYGLPIHWTIWVISLYMAFFSFSLPVMDSWAVNTSRTKVFILSVAFLAFGSLTAILAKKWVWFMWGRVIQSVGASGLVPCVSVYARRFLNRPGKWGKRVILFGLGFGFILMPLLSVSFAHELGWRSVFFVHLLLLLLLLLIVRRWSLPDQPRRVKGASGESILFFGLTILFLMTAVSSTDFLEGLPAFFDRDVLPLWIVAIGMVVPLFMVERQERQPFFDPHLFAHWRLWLLYLQVALCGFAWVALLLVPVWLVRVTRSNDFGIGALLSFILFCVLFSLPLIHGLTRKWNLRRTMSLGFSLAAVSYLVLAFGNHGIWFFSALVMLGFSFSFSLVAPVHQFLFSWVSPRQIRNGLTALGMFRTAGGAIGLTALARLFSSFSIRSAVLTDPLKRAAESNMLLFAAGVSLLGLVVSLLLPLNRQKEV
jgi:MFS family permease